MAKIKTIKYQHRKFLTNDQLQSEVVSLLSYNKFDNYVDELHFVLHSFLNLINNSRFIGGVDNFYSVDKIDFLKPTVKSIEKTVKAYLEGDILSAYNSFYYRWRYLCKEKFTDHNSLIQLKPNDKVYYRVRSDETQLSKKLDFFHVPFQLRGLLGNNRYSISGYPCLYLASSLYSCWEETRRPALNKFQVVAYKSCESLSVLDMRLAPDINTSNKEEGYLMILPYILASSIRTHNDSSRFKPEYIIPQLMLHSVVKSIKDSKVKYDGILFTSTRRNMSFCKDLSLCDNYVFPVKTCRKAGYCNELVKMFVCTDPISYESEQLQGKIHPDSNAKGYYATEFYALENILENKDFTTLL